MILCPVFSNLCLLTDESVVQCGRRVFTEVRVGFFAARRSLCRSSIATKHREVMYLLLLLNMMRWVWRLYPFEVTSVHGRSLHFQIDSSHFMKLQFILPSTSAIYCGLIFPRSDYFNLPKFFISKNIFLSWKLLRNRGFVKQPFCMAGTMKIFCIHVRKERVFFPIGKRLYCSSHSAM